MRFNESADAAVASPVQKIVDKDKAETVVTNLKAITSR